MNRENRSPLNSHSQQRNRVCNVDALTNSSPYHSSQALLSRASQFEFDPEVRPAKWVESSDQSLLDVPGAIRARGLNASRVKIITAGGVTA